MRRRGVTLRVAAIAALVAPRAGASDCYTLTLRDAWGDGWNGATIKVIGDDGHVYFEEWSGPTSAQKKVAIEKMLAINVLCPIGSYGIIIAQIVVWESLVMK